MTDNLMDDTVDTPAFDPDKDYLAVLTGPGGKFDKTKYPTELDAYKAMARGKVEADLYIDHTNKEKDLLRAEHLKLREEYNARAKLEELLDQRNKSQDLSNSDDNLNANDVKRPAYDPKEVENLVNSRIQEFENSKREQANFDLVRNKLKEKYGTNYQASLKTQVESLGLTDSFVNDLARKHPAVLLKTLGLDQQQPSEFQNPLQSTRTNQFAPEGSKERTYGYYYDMLQKNPKLYWDQKTQVQKHKDAVALGEKFKDAVWHATE